MTTDLSPSTTPSSSDRAPADVGVPAENRPAHDRVLADPGVGPQDRAFDGGMLFDVAVPADDGVRADTRAGLDDRAGVDERTGPRSSAPSSTRASGEIQVRGPPSLKIGGLEPPVHDVAVHLGVFLGRADVDPVAAIDVGDEGLAAFDQRREEAALDRPRRVAGNAIEGVGLEDVNAGVDRVAGDLVGLRLLEEAADVAVRIGLDQSVGATDCRPASGRSSPAPCARGAAGSPPPDRPASARRR